MKIAVIILSVISFIALLLVIINKNKKIKFLCTKKVNRYKLFVYQTGTLCTVIILNILHFVNSKIELLFFVYFFGYYVP